ncbi:unnamed protein product, partial [Nesidiocoris tenuis]
MKHQKNKDAPNFFGYASVFRAAPELSEDAMLLSKDALETQNLEVRESPMKILGDELLQSMENLQRFQSCLEMIWSRSKKFWIFHEESSQEAEDLANMASKGWRCSEVLWICFTFSELLLISKKMLWCSPETSLSLKTWMC